ncbi:hypothetical protein IH785_00870 [candidate division KSB1 bacterium]|nr:hypothetical protein [candidate division KSB1 bacterium]
MTLFDGEQIVGRHDIIWNGRNGEGAPVASGVYLVRMEANDPSTGLGQGFVRVRKMVLAR